MPLVYPTVRCQVPNDLDPEKWTTLCDDLALSPPHFHAKYGEHQAQVAIETGAVLNGALPRRALGLVQEWVLLHRDELADDWRRAERQEPLANIEPLP